MAHLLMRLTRSQNFAALKTLDVCCSGIASSSGVFAENMGARRYADAAGNDSKQSGAPRYDTATKRKILVNRIMYRSKQRGFLEMDLLLGLWAQENVPKAEEPVLAAFEGMLDLENPDLFKWLTGQEEPPSELENNLAFKEVRRSIGSQLHNIVQSSAKTQPGTPWLRGWDDWKKELPNEDVDKSQ